MGANLPTILVADKIIGMILNLNNHEMIKDKFISLSEKAVPISKINYYLASLYNLAIEIENSEKNETELTDKNKVVTENNYYRNGFNYKKNNRGFQTRYNPDGSNIFPNLRSYTSEDFENAYDTLDEFYEDICLVEKQLAEFQAKVKLCKNEPYKLLNSKKSTQILEIKNLKTAKLIKNFNLLSTEGHSK